MMSVTRIADICFVLIATSSCAKTPSPPIPETSPESAPETRPESAPAAPDPRGILHSGALDRIEPAPPGRDEPTVPRTWLLRVDAAPLALDTAKVARTIVGLAGRAVVVTGTSAGDVFVVETIAAIDGGIRRTLEGVLEAPGAGFDSGAPGWRVGGVAFGLGELNQDSFLGRVGKHVRVEVVLGTRNAFYEDLGHRIEAAWIAVAPEPGPVHEGEAGPRTDPPAEAVLGVWDKVPDAPWRAKATAMATDDPRRALCLGLMYERELCEGEACTCWVSPVGIAGGERPLVAAAVIGVSLRPKGYADPTVEEWALVIDTGPGWVVGNPAMSYHEDKIGFYHRSRLTLSRSDAGRPLIRLDVVESADDFGPGDSEIVREIAWSILCGASEGAPRCVNVERGVREGPTPESLAAVWRRDLEIGDDGRVTLGSIDAPDKVVGVRVAAGTYTLEALHALTLPPAPDGGGPHEDSRAQDDATPP